MFEHIENIRQKSDREKRRIAFLLAFLFSSLIFVLWYFAVFPNFKEQDAIDRKIEKLEEEGPASSLGSVLSGSLTEIKNKIAEIKNLTSYFSDESSYYISTRTTETSTSTKISTTTDSINTEMYTD